MISLCTQCCQPPPARGRWFSRGRLIKYDDTESAYRYDMALKSILERRNSSVRVIGFGDLEALQEESSDIQELKRITVYCGTNPPYLITV